MTFFILCSKPMANSLRPNFRSTRKKTNEVTTSRNMLLRNKWVKKIMQVRRIISTFVDMKRGRLSVWMVEVVVENLAVTRECGE